jgi:hypothetical protein
MKKKSFLPKAAIAAIIIWGGISCPTNHGYSPTGQFWQFNLKQIDKGY